MSYRWCSSESYAWAKSTSCRVRINLYESFMLNSLLCRLLILRACILIINQHSDVFDDYTKISEVWSYFNVTLWGRYYNNIEMLRQTKLNAKILQLHLQGFERTNITSLLEAFLRRITIKHPGS